MKFKFDKSMLSDYLIEKQKAKGTYDSPCLSVCDYNLDTDVCQTCGLIKDEKKLWKVSDITIKEKIAHDVIERTSKKLEQD
jgi:predicted Fe-S protein YdhL (DUF1289 family)